MKHSTSAGEWQPRREDNTATARPRWKEEGFSKKYLWLFTWAVTAIAQWAEKRKKPPVADEQPFSVRMPSGFSFGLFWLASSYFILKKSVDITSLRGNAPGPDNQTYYEVFQGPDWGDSILRGLRGRLRNGLWRPGGLREVAIRMGAKVRLLHIPNLIDRVVERAIVLVLTPVLEFAFHPWSFGFRPGLSSAHAFRELFRLCSSRNRFVLGKIDLKDAFDRVPHQRLLDIVRIWVKDDGLSRLIASIVNRPCWRNKQGKQNVGLPQGGPLSPLLFNLYLNHCVDQVLAKKHPGIVFIRWADDILLVCESNDQLKDHRATVEHILNDAGLAVNRDKTDDPANTADLRAGESVKFLGYRVEMNGEGQLRLSVDTEAYERLLTQLQLDAVIQKPNVSWGGYRAFLSDQILFTIGSWLEAFAGAIEPHLWPEVRKELKGWFLGSSPEFLRLFGDQAQSLPINCPSTADLNRLYDRARGHWLYRFGSPLLITVDRPISPLQRDAHANQLIRQLVSDHIADGADLVPAPQAFVEPYADRKPNWQEVEWRVRFAPLHMPDGGTVKAGSSQGCGPAWTNRED